MSRKVLFVCMGNICRSPAAEAVLQKQAETAGRSDQFHIDSAGTTGYHTGEKADSRMRQAASKRGYQLNSRARQVVADDLKTFDLVVAMDQANLAHLNRLASRPSARVCLFHDFLDDQWPIDVPDPYYGGDEGFEFVLNMLEAGCPAILKQLTDSQA